MFSVGGGVGVIDTDTDGIFAAGGGTTRWSMGCTVGDSNRSV